MSATVQIHEPQQQGTALKRVLVATDFSPASEHALGYAIAIARRYDATLSILHAIAPQPRSPIPMGPTPHELNRPRLEAEAHMNRLGDIPELKNLNHHFLLEQGEVWDVLCPAMELEKPDLLVLGTHGRGGLKKLALGSIAEEVLRRAPCPVLTVGPEVAPARHEAIEFKNIVFATDFEAASTKALPYALSLAEEHGAKLALLHMLSRMPCSGLGPYPYAPSAHAAYEFVKWQRTLRDEAEKKLRNLIPPDAHLAAQPSYIVETSFLPEGILDLAAKNKSDLIVMGADLTPAPRLAAHTPWHLTHEVICHATCPVLTVSE